MFTKVLLRRKVVLTMYACSLQLSLMSVVLVTVCEIFSLNSSYLKGKRRLRVALKSSDVLVSFFIGPNDLLSREVCTCAPEICAW